MKNISKRKLTLYISGTVLILIGIFFLLNHTFYSFTFKSNKQITSVKSSTTGESIFRIGSLYIVPKTITSVTFSSGSDQTVFTLTDRPIIGYKSEQVELKSQKNTSKIGSNGLGCDVENKNIYFSYDCSGSNKSILKYTPDVFNNTLSENILPSDLKSTTPYNSGFLSIIGESGDSSVVYSDFSGNILSQINLPGKSDTSSLKIIPNTTQGGFVVIDQNNKKIYILEDTGSKPVVLGSKDIADGELVACDFKNMVIECLVTSYKHEDESEENHIDSDDDSIDKVTKVRYDILSKKISNSTLPISTSFNSFCIGDDGLGYALADNYSLYTLSDNKMYLSNQNVRGLWCGQRNVYTTDKSVYEINKNQASLVFTSSKLSISIVTNKKDLLFSAYSEDGVLHGYKIINTPLDTRRREDFLPLPTNSANLPIDSIDYRGDEIFIKPRVEITSDHQTGTTTINMEQFEQAKKQINDYLNANLKNINYSVTYVNPIN